MTTYRVTACRDLPTGYWWVEIDGVGGATQARHLRDVERMAREYVALKLDVPADSFDLDVDYDLPDNVTEHVQAAKEWHAREAEARTEGSREVRVAARQLVEMGLPLRDVGQVLGVSYQRAHQLVSSGS